MTVNDLLAFIMEIPEEQRDFELVVKDTDNRDRHDEYRKIRSNILYNRHDETVILHLRNDD